MQRILSGSGTGGLMAALLITRPASAAAATAQASCSPSTDDASNSRTVTAVSAPPEAAMASAQSTTSAVPSRPTSDCWTPARQSDASDQYEATRMRLLHVSWATVSVT